MANDSIASGEQRGCRECGETERHTEDCRFADARNSVDRPRVRDSERASEAPALIPLSVEEDRELSALREEMDLHSLGDRPSSISAAKLERLIELEVRSGPSASPAEPANPVAVPVRIWVSRKGYEVGISQGPCEGGIEYVHLDPIKDMPAGKGRPGAVTHINRNKDKDAKPPRVEAAEVEASEPDETTLKARELKVC